MSETVRFEGAYFPDDAFMVVSEDVARGVPEEIVVSCPDGGHALIQLGRVFGNPAARYFAIDQEGNPWQARQGFAVSFEQALEKTLGENSVTAAALSMLAQSMIAAQGARS